MGTLWWANHIVHKPIESQKLLKVILRSQPYKRHTRHIKRTRDEHPGHVVGNRVVTLGVELDANGHIVDLTRVGQ